MNISERLKIAREKTQKSQREFASLIGASYRSLQDYEAGISVPGGKVIEAYVRQGFNGNWLLIGDGEIYRQTGNYDNGINSIMSSREVNPSKAIIRYGSEGLEGGSWDVYDIQCSRDPGDWQKFNPVERIILPDHYADEMYVLKVSGSSMEPTLHNGAIIGLAYGPIGFRSGKIHVLWIPGEGPVVRRVFVDLEKITIKADNPVYPDIMIQTNDIPKKDFILGIVHWVLQDL